MGHGDQGMGHDIYCDEGSVVHGVFNVRLGYVERELRLNMDPLFVTGGSQSIMKATRFPLLFSGLYF